MAGICQKSRCRSKWKRAEAERGRAMMHAGKTGKRDGEDVARHSVVRTERWGWKTFMVEWSQ
eukprot:2577284-Prorocentrum_lima.AAC.1